MRFEYVKVTQWPPLAWLARCERRSGRIRIYHGRSVEVGTDFFCEAIWAGRFDDADFDHTDIVAGSGGRLRPDGCRFVSAGSTVDRLQTIETLKAVWVSNSLPCLIAAVGGVVDASYADYYADAASIILGLDRYKSVLPTSVGDVELVYFDNVRWDGTALSRERKPSPDRDFSSFKAYRSFLESSMAAVVANLTASSRRHTFRMLGTLSSGYDSSTVSVLTRAHGLAEVLTFDVARHGGSDSGEGVARQLGLQVHTIGRDAWRAVEFVEVPFIASYSSAEDIVFAGAEAHLKDRVLFTGYHGDKVWDKLTKNLSPQIVRGDPSGLSLTEYRLWTGFINCAVPFWGVRQIRDIHAISNDPSMAPWDVPGGYSRPICRRIVEEAGIAREAFGGRKRAVTVNPFAGHDLWGAGQLLFSAAARDDYLEWIRRHRSAWLRRFRFPPVPSERLSSWITRGHMRCVDAVNGLGRVPLVWRVVPNKLYQPQYLHRYFFPWALARAAERYAPWLPD